MKKLFIGVLLICSTAIKAGEAQTLPAKNFNAVFELYKSGLLVAESQYIFRQQQQPNFKSSSHLKGFVSLFNESEIAEQSFFDTSKNHIRLTQYQYKQTGDNNKQISSLVDWKRQRITTIRNDQKEIITPFKNTIWDKHSLLLALMSNAQKNDKELNLQVLDKGIVKLYKFIYTGSKEIELDEDEWVVTSVWQRQTGNRKTVFYLDPKNHFIPLKIEQHKNQQQATLWLKEINWYD